ncbi:small integral membrane protein 11A [Oryzias latipes]|uniref:Small integral membrane protein 11A n=1 Tax=Oryzias latipes TaxID=8090 RepID=A0A3B3HNA2_ORYLA|nr:small integral membrane protein 11A [Oryzias latipes]
MLLVGQVRPRLHVSVVVFTDGEQDSRKMINWKVLDNVPLLLYILALKTFLLCLGFAGVKIYQSRRAEEALRRQRAEERRLQEAPGRLKED